MMDAIVDIPTARLLWAMTLVTVGTTFQVAGGVGLGLIAGPAFLLLLEPQAAVLLAIVLNLVLSLVLLPFELRDIDWGRTVRLSLWAAPGIPLGLAFLATAGGTLLRLVGGFLVSLACVQLLLSGNEAMARLGRRIGLRSCGVASGIMAGALGAPGPIALWALLGTDLDVEKIRAVLRAYFVFSYGAALLLFVVIWGVDATVPPMVVALLPALALGIGAGSLAKRRVPARWLRLALVGVLVATAAALMYSGARDVLEF